MDILHFYSMSFESLLINPLRIKIHLHMWRLRSYVTENTGNKCASIGRSVWLLLYGETITVSCYNHMEHLNALCGQYAEVLCWTRQLILIFYLHFMNPQ